MATRKSHNSDRVFRLIGIGAALLLVLAFSPPVAHVYTEVLWFESLGRLAVFARRITAAATLAGITAVISIAFLLLNWSLLPHWIAPKGRLVGTLPFRVPRPTKDRGQSPQIEISTRPLRLAFTVAAVILGLLIGISLLGQWDTYLLAREGADFGRVDPIFGRDIGFYVFRLPWYRVTLGIAQGLTALALIGVVVRLVLFGQLANRGATAHLSLLGALLLSFIGAGRLLSRHGLLLSNGGVIFGAGYTDIHARLPLYTVEAVLFFVAAGLLVVNLFARQWKLLVGIGLFWVALTLVGPLYPSFVQQISVEPNEFIMERPYIEHNIEHTRYAYGLDRIVEYDYATTGELTLQDLEAHADVLANVRLWDYRPLLRTYGQLQEFRLYYSFSSVDVDRYQLDGRLTQVMLAVRELDVDELAEQAQTWINRHLIFTHGYGLAMSSANEVTPDGLPRLLVRDVPPVSEHPELRIDRPEIYFGELTQAYALVNAAEDEFNYPQGDRNAYTRYTGPDGVRLGTLLRRALLASRFGSPQLLLSSALSADSRILYHRTVRERAEALAPMLRYDGDPYPVIVDGRIVWILDAFTWTGNYPYAQPTGTLNYIRNSVKVTVDAYTGEIHFYLIDATDPIAAAYARIFPTLFEPLSAMPESLRGHWRYPEALYLVQAELYATYHMRDPQVFYNREDLWDVPQELVETSQQAMEPYYVTMRLPDSERLEFLLIRPYVPKERQNMVAWLYAHCDGDRYGELGIFKLSKDRLIYGPLQIEGRIDQDPVISQQLALWNQRGSHILRGNLLVIPIDNAFLYVEPLYLEAQASQLPELARVVAAYGDRVTMAPTLDEALIDLFGGAPRPSSDSPGDRPADSVLGALAAEAWQHFQAAQDCLSRGDWVCYGEEQAALEAILHTMAGDGGSP